VDLRELWEYRELTLFFVWRDLKVRYKQTAFGVLWAVLQPVAFMVVFTLILSRTSDLSPPGIPYPLFAFAALLPWTLFSQSLIGASDSLVVAANLIQKVYFPRLLVPIAAVCSYLLDFVISLAVLAALIAFSGVGPTVNVILLLPLTGLTLITASAFGIWLAAINVRYRDVRYAVPFLVQLWLFASPVAYPSSVIPPEWRLIYDLNPMVGVIDGFRWAILGSPAAVPAPALAISVVVSMLVLATGLAYFRRMERTFADVI
jgi:lipopolysaccharide transport system permease protein